MLVSTPVELLRASLAAIAGEVNYNDVQISENLVMTIKVDGEEWQDAKYFDYKSALIVEAIQRDFLGLYNAVSGNRILISNLDNYTDLIVKIQIKDGCLEYVIKGMHYILRYAKDMNPEQRLKLAALVFGMVACGTLPWAASSMYSSWTKKEIERYKTVPAIIESIGKAEKILSGNRRTQRVIIEHSSDSTKVSIGGDAFLTVEDMKGYDDNAPKAEIPETHYIDGNYAVLKYDFHGQQAAIRIGRKDEWVSTGFLEAHDREKIKVLACKAIDEGNSQKEHLQVTIQTLNGEVVSAAIMGIGAPRPNSKPLREALLTKQQLQTVRQAALLPHAGPAK